MVQWLELRAPNAGGPGLIPTQGTRSHMPQLRLSTVNFFFFLRKKEKSQEKQLEKPTRRSIDIWSWTESPKAGTGRGRSGHTEATSFGKMENWKGRTLASRHSFLACSAYASLSVNRAK